MIENRLAKLIKKTLYAKPQRAKITFPPGFSETAFNEVKLILANLWFPQKFTPKISLLKNAIHIDEIHIISMMELLMRSQCISDIRLIIYEGKAFGIKTFYNKCLNIPWHLFIDKSMLLKIKVDSIASEAFHETALREMLSDILRDKVADIVTGERKDETTGLTIELYKNKLTVSLSLAGKPLYQRGYRGVLSASAPLREDAAACCIQNAYQFIKKIDKNFNPNTILIPFAGTGTFAFEFMQFYFHFSPVLFNREYAIQKMPFYKESHFNYLFKKAKQHCYASAIDWSVICIDNSNSAISALTENKKMFEDKCCSQGFLMNVNMEIKNEDFFQFELSSEYRGNIFLPLNPPYGLRLSKNKNTIAFYKNIAVKINELAASNHGTILGFILCPSEETWSVFCKTLRNAKMETYHFMQGGMDIRVCQFALLSSLRGA